MRVTFRNGHLAMNQGASQDIAKLVLRLALGGLILLHGIHKLQHGLGGVQDMVASHGLPAFIAYGVLVGEVLAPLMLIAGLYARVGAALVMVNMLFALALAHMGQLGALNGQGGWALELQGMFIAAAIAIALLGPGRFSVNQQ